jgi:Family of unknown function (DUF6893)
MSEIRIGPAAQLIACGVVLIAVLAGVAAQVPEIQRYLKVRKM